MFRRLMCGGAVLLLLVVLVLVLAVDNGEENKKPKLIEATETGKSAHNVKERTVRLLEQILEEMKEIKTTVKNELLQELRELNGQAPNNVTDSLRQELEELRLDRQVLQQELQDTKNSTETMRQELNELRQKVSAAVTDGAKSSNKETISSCQDVTTSGIYKRDIDGLPAPIEVYCEAETFDGGWTVIQQRLDGSIPFNRSFAEYRDGFGKVGPSVEFWLGLEAMHLMTSKGECELAVEMKNDRDVYHYVRYTDFGVDNEATQYTLSRVGILSGTATTYDPLGMYALHGKFYTYDKDFSTGMAANRGGGWWYGTGWYSWLNGFYKSFHDIYWEKVGWQLKYTRMMLRC